jgi:phospholipid/cholesterol/gamma-HCH transport system ATP-binding protein
VVDIRHLTKSFDGKTVLTDINLRVGDDKSAVVMGGSGTGKSVLVKHVVGLLRPDSGEVWALGKRVDRLEGDELDRLRLSTGYVFQGGALFDSMTVNENLDFILERHSGLSKAERKDRIAEALEWVRLPEKGWQYPAELSGGQKKRVGVARAIILEPELMLYDEPTTGLDPISVRTVSELIVRLRDDRGITSITITHDLLCAEIIADTVHFLSDGRLVASGELEDVRAMPHPEIRNFFGG